MGDIDILQESLIVRGKNARSIHKKFSLKRNGTFRPVSGTTNTPGGLGISEPNSPKTLKL
jgi:hypothetical protein